MDKVVVQGRGHLEPPVIPQVEHGPRLCLRPMLPPVGLDSEFVRFSTPVNPVPGVFSHAVGVETMIQKFNLILLIYIRQDMGPCRCC